MKVRELYDLLKQYAPDDELEIEVYETISGKYVDSSFAVRTGWNKWGAHPVLAIDIEAGKFKQL